MKLVRTAAALAGGAFLAWQSVGVFLALLERRPGSLALTVLVAWIFNMFVTGAFALPGFVLPTHRLAPAAYYRVRRPGRLRAVCGALGVGPFRRALLATLWRDPGMQRRFFDGTPAGLKRMEAETRSAEFGHALPFLLITAASVAWAAAGGVRLAVAATAFNVLGNFYPVLLQRLHRARLVRVLGRARG